MSFLKGTRTNNCKITFTGSCLSYTYWFVFVYDRTQEDVFRAIELNGGKYINRTITPEEKEEWMAGIKGALNLLDLQRIEWNTRLIGDFELIKISVSVKEWKRGNIPNVSDFIRILDNIQKIRGADIQLIRSQTYDRTQKCLTGEPIYYNSDEGR